MKPVTLFYQPRCPFCKKALGYLEELQRQEPYSRIVEAVLRMALDER